MSTITLPQLIDCHVHFREPGFEHKATMQSESLAANAGGVFTVCDMPNTNPPTTTEKAFLEKVAIADKVDNCDVRLFFGITEASHIDELRKIHNHPRLCGVKLYLDHSTGNQKVDGDIVSDIFKVCTEFDLPLVAHCEDPETNQTAFDANSIMDASAHSANRPPESEETSIAYAIRLAQQYDTKLHVAHVSTKEGIDLIRTAKADGISVTCEVAPHHLFLTIDDYERLGTLVKMNPPVRSQEHQDALWIGIRDGTVDCVATDHAPHTLDEKKIEPALDAPSGVPGVETMLPLLLTAVSEEKISYDDIAKLCFENPNRFFNLRKSGSETITIDPDVEWTIEASKLKTKCGWTPYEGMKVKGKML